MTTNQNKIQSAEATQKPIESTILTSMEDINYEMDENDELEIKFGQQFEEACMRLQDKNKALNLLKEYPDLVWYRDPKTGDSPLHWACKLGDLEVVKCLFANRHPWNIINEAGQSAGDVCEHYSHKEIYEELVNEGVRAELLLSILNKLNQKEEEELLKLESNGEEILDFEVQKGIPNEEYLKKPLKFEDDKILDFENNGVMMGWEAPLMKRHAEVLINDRENHVLNIGFGLGLIDTELQKYSPTSHTIVEAHPDVYQRMLDLGWDKKPNVTIIFGRWQEVIPQLKQKKYTGIFFDTFGEYYEDLKEFHELLPILLHKDGTYSFFNGLGGDVKLFHDVYCRVVEIHLKELNLSTKFEKMLMDPNDNKIWDGVKRRYWHLKDYYLPICNFN